MSNDKIEEKSPKTSHILVPKLNFKIGADPEFAMTMQGRKIDAKQTLEFILRDKEPFKPIRLNGGNDRTGGFAIGNLGNVGWDNHTATAEIRPTAADDPQTVVNNMAAIFKELVKYTTLFDLTTISEFGPIGGHIHLQIPKGLKLTSDKQISIHRKVASFYLPVMLSENKTNLNLRLRANDGRGTQYGFLKDFRIEPRFQYPDGSPGYTYEFRCPSAEWLTTPKIAKATLSYLMVVYNEVINHPKEFMKFNDLVYKSDKQGEALQSLAIMEYDLLTKQILSKTKKYIRNFELYGQYKDDIEYILNPTKVIADKIKADYNIALGWGLSDKRIPTKKIIFSSKTKMKELAKNGDFDQIKKVMNIHYNDDTNVATFANNLKDRVAAFNWKLKNNYFIFGMRKGINEIICRNLQDDYFSGRKLIKTVLDRNEIDNLFRKMTDKFFDTGAIQSNTVIDFRTGKPKNMQETSIIIALPYKMRVEEDMKPFLELVWNLENDKITPERFKNTTEELRDDTIGQIPMEERGEIYRILTKQKPEINENNIQMAHEDMDRGRQNIIRNVMDEEREINDDDDSDFQTIDPVRAAERVFGPLRAGTERNAFDIVDNLLEDNDNQ